VCIEKYEDGDSAHAVMRAGKKTKTIKKSMSHVGAYLTALFPVNLK
jgi:hypothetical protein